MIVIVYKSFTRRPRAASTGTSTNNSAYSAGDSRYNSNTGSSGTERPENNKSRQYDNSGWSINESNFKDRISYIRTMISSSLAKAFDKNVVHKNMEALKVLRDDLHLAYKNREVSKEGFSELLNDIAVLFDIIKQIFEKESHNHKEREKEFEANEKELAWAVENFYNLVGVYDPHQNNHMKDIKDKIVYWKNFVYEVKKKGVRSQEIRKTMDLFEKGINLFSQKSESFREKMANDKDARNREWAEKQKEQDRKQKERDERQQENERKKREWEERQKEKERKQQEWDKEQARIKAESEARQQEYERNKRDREDRKRERDSEKARKQEEYDQRQRERESRKKR